VINPPAANKRCFWTGSETSFPKDVDQWIGKAKEHAGSWWGDWSGWLKSHAGKQIAAPKTYGRGKHKAIENAPGRYVKERASQ
jgi:polyhydroxyalkanoate synthase